MDIREQVREILEKEYGFGSLRNGRGSGPTVSPDARIGAGVQFGRDVIIHEGVQIGDGVRIFRKLVSWRLGA